MDLKTLSKTVSANWRNADEKVVAYCRKLAEAEQAKYSKIIRLHEAREIATNGITATTSPTSMAVTQSLLSDYNMAGNSGEGFIQRYEALNQMLLRQKLHMAKEATSTSFKSLPFGDASSTLLQPQQLTSRGSIHTKRKISRQASAPDIHAMFHVNSTDNMNNAMIGNEFMSHASSGNPTNNTGMRASIDNRSVVCNDNVFGDEDNNAKPFKRRSSISSVPDERQLQALKESFQMASATSMVIGNSDSNIEQGIFHLGGQASTMNTANHGVENPTKMPFVRRATVESGAPPLPRDLFTNSNIGTFHIGTNDVYYSNNKSRAYKKMRRRSSLSSMEPSLELAQELSDSFKYELEEHGFGFPLSFTCNPEWENEISKEDADTLLGLLGDDGPYHHQILANQNDDDYDHELKAAIFGGIPIVNTPSRAFVQNQEELINFNW